MALLSQQSLIRILCFAIMLSVPPTLTKKLPNTLTSSSLKHFARATAAVVAAKDNCSGVRFARLEHSSIFTTQCRL